MEASCPARGPGGWGCPPKSSSLRGEVGLGANAIGARILQSVSGETMSTRQRPPSEPNAAAKGGRSRQSNRRREESKRSWVVLGAAIAIILVIAALIGLR